ncbi:hypothetical protein GCM10009789_38200 [Kribbella sancticallisti]|uniref:Methyltransferase domain-containing protein n=1 Tax=Kribbella sancticallisti TaxID=460087 RepID=A0ABP4PGR1_9ACTN
MNAVQFAPRAGEFVGVDVTSASLRECERQVAAVCDTPFRGIHIGVDTPEQAIQAVGGPCDVFLSFCVFELIPTPEYGDRLLRIAFEPLSPGGVAFIQTKYDEGRFGTRPLRRCRPSPLAAQGCARRPEAVPAVVSGFRPVRSGL